MDALVVTAHPGTCSLNAALSDLTRKTLADAGHQVAESDLYAMGWDPVVTARDFGAAAAAHPSIGDQSAAAYADGSLAPDIVAEQEKLRRASLVVFHFPLWWYGMPAILKGWFDRVFVKGFAFGITDAAGTVRKYGDGGLAGKRALLVMTAGDRDTSFEPRGLNGEADELFFSILHGIFWYTGMSPLHPHIVAGADRPGWDRMDVESARLRERLAGITTEEPIPYRALADGEYDRARRLRPEYDTGQTGLRVHLRR